VPEAVEESVREGPERISLRHFEQLFLLSMKVLNYFLLLCTHSLHPIELQEGRSRIYALTAENHVRD